MACAFLGLGSNMGDRQRELDFALETLRNHADITLIKAAPILETDPVGYLEQAKFLNTVVEIETALEPALLLAALQQIEDDAGRVRTVCWGPRTLDIDILLYDNLVLSEPNLIIPHPQLRQREFVLVPLAHLAPNLPVPPDNRTVRELLDQYQQSR
ncbi:MAG: 2-amino-4-hydroxy-6-hydroxymethyldihydropteridine diphosphokinase [Firmicutes bacterium]|nr:2-amino-4-hydroxy-6-hydroxymethyldihydropteridine diphosphokinase [Dethiobacter sp.]MBS3897580.1 2-amino-4-hydroxy-6-hydroxymethyldihydropteridine diphosphokinase [Dethiobacter sp.]MBS3948701.1 2-amino-4-hydroxy-6-hydroxymethyldihydropteridine diphosphokinase [Dethiobacter sp.]MCL4463818.1 2-amino-4-hydroxy-6-hydroxymethyldihydropteridine diphosphokinase [Bacillota bacterium]MCL5993437.1 2-amino-4-hydroxy-6-hydroxymethyldihydropteridine diphosphokinase [Bacillota bacterium]